MAVAADFHRDFLIIGYAFIPDNEQKLPDALRLFFCNHIIQSRYCFVNLHYRQSFLKKFNKFFWSKLQSLYSFCSKTTNFVVWNVQNKQN